MIEAMDEQERKEALPTAGSEQDTSVRPDFEPQPDLPPELRELMAAPVEKAKKRAELQEEGDRLSNLALTTAGFTVLNGVLVLIYAILWMVDINLLVAMLAGRAWISLLLGWVPMILGAIILKRNEKRDTPVPGTNWARAAVAVGVVMVLMSVGVPFIANLQKMLMPL